MLGLFSIKTTLCNDYGNEIVTSSILFGTVLLALPLKNYVNSLLWGVNTKNISIDSKNIVHKITDEVNLSNQSICLNKVTKTVNYFNDTQTFENGKSLSTINMVSRGLETQTIIWGFNIEGIALFLGITAICMGLGFYLISFNSVVPKVTAPPFLSTETPLSVQQALDLRNHLNFSIIGEKGVIYHIFNPTKAPGGSRYVYKERFQFFTD